MSGRKLGILLRSTFDLIMRDLFAIISVHENCIWPGIIVICVTPQIWGFFSVCGLLPFSPCELSYVHVQCIHQKINIADFSLDLWCISFPGKKWRRTSSRFARKCLQRLNSLNLEMDALTKGGWTKKKPDTLEIYLVFCFSWLVCASRGNGKRWEKIVEIKLQKKQIMLS